MLYKMNKRMDHFKVLKLIIGIILIFHFFGCSPDNTSNDNRINTENYSASSGDNSETKETKETNHPFLIVTKDMFSTLRENPIKSPGDQ